MVPVLVMRKERKYLKIPAHLYKEPAQRNNVAPKEAHKLHDGDIPQCSGVTCTPGSDGVKTTPWLGLQTLLRSRSTPLPSPSSSPADLAVHTSGCWLQLLEVWLVSRYYIWAIRKSVMWKSTPLLISSLNNFPVPHLNSRGGPSEKQLQNDKMMHKLNL